MSKATSISPFRDGSFGSGKPYPVIRLTVFGLITSCIVLIRNLSPPNVGTSNTTPHKACKLTKQKETKFRVNRGLK